MKLSLGENMRFLRKEKKMTQEELAEALGVSFQTVSRWETGLCYPDMEMLPDIAGFFSVTVDKLLGTDKALERRRVEEYLNRFREAASRGDVEECIRVAREGVAEYPHEYALLNKLMYALFMAGDSGGGIPDWEENRQKYDAEVTALGEHIMKHCPDQEIRLEAVGRLAFNHCEMGRRAIGRRIYETLPPMRLCREQQIRWGLEEEEKLSFLREKLQSSYDALDAAMYTLMWARLLPDEQLLQVWKKRRELRRLVYDGADPVDSWRQTDDHCVLAKIYARLGLRDEALGELALAAQCARVFDTRPESAAFFSLLLGKREIRRGDFETDDARPLSQILREKWMASRDFDGMRDSREFQSILAEP